MLRNRLKRFEIYQETAQLLSVTSGGQAGSGVALTRQPSEEALLKITVVDNVALSLLTINPNGASPEVITVTDDGDFWSVNSYTAVTEIDYEANIGNFVIEQWGKSREPIQQLTTRSTYVYGTPLTPSTGGLDRLPVGETADTDVFHLIIPRRWRECGIQKKDWIKDADDIYYRVESLEIYPDDHMEVQVQRAKV